MSRLLYTLSTVEQTIGKLNTKNIYNGCLAELKDELTDELPPGKNWVADKENMAQNGIKNIVGMKDPVDAHDSPYTAPSYIKIYFGSYFIQPISYSLMGRRNPNPEHDRAYLKSWDFLGRTKNNEWKLLSSIQNQSFSKAEERTYQIYTQESYNGFMINMTEKNTDGNWAICLGQIDVHGFIFQSYNAFRRISQSVSSFKSYFILFYTISVS